VARTFQAPRPFPEWTVRQNVAVAAERAGNLPSVEPLLEELDLVSLGDRPAAQLSVGEGKRLEIARALACRPAVLLLDEPLAGLAPDAARRVFERVDQTRREGVGVLWVEHGARPTNPADRLLVLEAGRARWLGSSAGPPVERLEPSS
jgi:ABC-type branched-subunit amino acid transport system ATPase component